LMETLGPKNWKAIGGDDFEITHSPEIEACLKKLTALHDLYNEISKSLSAYVHSLKNLIHSEETMHWTMSESAVHEEDLGLREELSTFSEMHKRVNKVEKDLLIVYQCFTDHVNTYFHKAIEDCMATAKKYKSLRLEYDAFKTKLSSLEHEMATKGLPKIEKEIELAKVQVEESRQAYTEVSEQLISKIEVLYNLKIQNLRDQIKGCKKAMEQYFSQASFVFEPAEREQ